MPWITLKQNGQEISKNKPWLFRKKRRDPHYNGKYHYRYERARRKRDEKSFMPMGHNFHHGGASPNYDYSPLYRFLTASVGKCWDDVYSEAVQRLNSTKPIWWYVDLRYDVGNTRIRLGVRPERFYIDHNHILKSYQRQTP